MTYRLASGPMVPWVKAQPPDELPPPTLAPVKTLGAGYMVLSVRFPTDAVTNEVINDLFLNHNFIKKKKPTHTCVEFCFNAKKQ